MEMEPEEIALLNEYRLALDETWRQYAERFGMNHQRLYQVLQAVNKPGPRTVYRLLKFITSHRSDIEAALGHPISTGDSPTSGSVLSVSIETAEAEDHQEAFK